EEGGAQVRPVTTPSVHGGRGLSARGPPCDNEAWIGSDSRPGGSAMTRPKCDLCERPATIHETAVGADGPVVRHLCREHGTHVWAAALPPLTSKARDDF